LDGPFDRLSDGASAVTALSVTELVEVPKRPK